MGYMTLSFIVYAENEDLAKEVGERQMERLSKRKTSDLYGKTYLYWEPTGIDRFPQIPHVMPLKKYKGQKFCKDDIRFYHDMLNKNINDFIKTLTQEKHALMRKQMIHEKSETLERNQCSDIYDDALNQLISEDMLKHITNKWDKHPTRNVIPYIVSFVVKV